ncbi:protein of unknown function, might belong to transporter [Moritella yayanosii]|uniref:Uncharacterized protein n=1 Tax=Moritella yayanosii TaxID=69539 RepID=A0A330LQR6_9GAMM|nr:protein of unknown function, might belong to transporter [Moritella yayanosii]
MLSVDFKTIPFGFKTIAFGVITCGTRVLLIVSSALCVSSEIREDLIAAVITESWFAEYCP